MRGGVSSVWFAPLLARTAGLQMGSRTRLLSTTKTQTPFDFSLHVSPAPTIASTMNLSSALLKCIIMTNVLLNPHCN